MVIVNRALITWYALLSMREAVLLLVSFWARRPGHGGAELPAHVHTASGVSAPGSGREPPVPTTWSEAPTLHTQEQKQRGRSVHIWKLIVVHQGSFCSKMNSYGKAQYQSHFQILFMKPSTVMLSVLSVMENGDACHQTHVLGKIPSAALCRPGAAASSCPASTSRLSCLSLPFQPSCISRLNYYTPNSMLLYFFPF